MIQKISEIVLMVEDVPAAASFYRDAVGLTPERPADESWAWFQLGDSGSSRIGLHHGSLLFEDQSPHPPGERWGPVHFALAVERRNLPQAIGRVRQHDVEVHGPVRLDWMAATSYYFYDPDGNLVEFWSPDPMPEDQP
ncbi:MAG: VOC family protein [Anaerolineales bacterium]